MKQKKTHLEIPKINHKPRQKGSGTLAKRLKSIFHTKPGQLDQVPGSDH